MSSLYQIVHEKTVEPVKRNKDGLRWIVHRFPIRNGISLQEAFRRDLIESAMRPNPFTKMLRVA